MGIQVSTNLCILIASEFSVFLDDFFLLARSHYHELE